MDDSVALFDNKLPIVYLSKDKPHQKKKPQKFIQTILIRHCIPISNSHYSILSYPYHSEPDPVLMIITETSTKLLRELILRNVFKQLSR